MRTIEHGIVCGCGVYSTAERGRDSLKYICALRAEREALSLLHFLRDHDKPQSEWLAALSSDPTLSAPVRQRALQFAREWQP